MAKIVLSQTKETINPCLAKQIEDGDEDRGPPKTKGRLYYILYIVGAKLLSIYYYSELQGYITSFSPTAVHRML